MRLQSLAELEKSIGGRPQSTSNKVRLSYYLDIEDYQQLKNYAASVDKPLSLIVREQIKQLISVDQTR